MVGHVCLPSIISISSEPYKNSSVPFHLYPLEKLVSQCMITFIDDTQKPNKKELRQLLIYVIIKMILF